MDFNKYNFEVIDISFRRSTDIFVNLSGLTITKKVIEDMSFPAFIRPLIDVEHKAFALQTCKQNDERAIKFSKPRGEQDKGIMKDNWRDDKRYRINGMYYSDSKAMVFDLASADELDSIRPMKKRNSFDVKPDEFIDSEAASI